VHSVFGVAECTRLAIVVGNQVISPFTTKGHLLARTGALDDPVQRAAFRRGLEALRQLLLQYTRALADMAGVEALTAL
jgi:hypothetical protein